MCVCVCMEATGYVCVYIGGECLARCRYVGGYWLCVCVWRTNGGEYLAMEVSAWLGVCRRLLARCVCI